MKIGFIGAGQIGGGLARLAVQAGHEVIVSNSRDPLGDPGADSHRDWMCR